MAAMDFPSAPAVDQLFTASTGAVYKWNGTLWLTVGNTSAIYVGDTPPTNPWKSQLWYHTGQARLYIYYDDGNTTQWVPSAPIPATSTPPTPPPAPGADAGCKTVNLVGNVGLTGGAVSYLNTGAIGLADQKWKISAVVSVNNNPANWHYADLTDSVVAIASLANYNGVNGATAVGNMERIIILTGPTTFHLRMWGTSATAQGGTTGSSPTSITATRLT